MEYKDGLETDRLVTRFLRESDIPAWCAYFEDPENCRFLQLPDENSIQEKAAIMVNYAIKRYRNNTLGLQALIKKDSDELIGMCGLLVQEVNGKKEIEVGYHLLKRFWGKGYAAEAAQMFRDYGFTHSETDSIISIIDPLNEPSKNVARRNGMQLQQAAAPFRGSTYNIFSISREEWEGMHGRREM